MIRAIFPGSFDPIHNGHIDIALRASKLVEELLIGVYDRPLKNYLFTPEERISMAKEVFDGSPNIKVVGYSGLTVDFCKQNNIQAIVRGLRVFSDFEYEFRMALTNHRLAPDVEVISLITGEEHVFLSSSTVREIASLNGDVSTMVPANVLLALRQRFKSNSEDQLLTTLQNQKG